MKILRLRHLDKSISLVRKRRQNAYYTISIKNISLKTSIKSLERSVSGLEFLKKKCVSCPVKRGKGKMGLGLRKINISSFE